MATPEPSGRPGLNRRAAGGLALIIVGVALQLIQLNVITGDRTLLALGVALLAGYAFTGHYGLLVSGSVLTGLGAGLTGRAWAGSGTGAVSLGLGLGLLAIPAIERTRGVPQPSRWPVVPGIILTTVGVLLTARVIGLLELIGRWWPMILVAIGVWMLLRQGAPSED
jgi:hypothetical protein